MTVNLPKNCQEKDLWRSQRAAVRELLYFKWDPIGISSIGGPKDEYNSYADQALAMTRNGTDQQGNIKFLLWVREVHMGLGPTPNDDIERGIVGDIQKLIGGD